MKSNWLEPDELAGSAFAPSHGQGQAASLPLGRLCARGDPPLNYHGRAHMFCVAPSGSGKSQALAIPALLTWPHSAIILDVKGELYHASASYRITLGGEGAKHRVFRFDPSDRDSHKFNPLAFIDTEPFAIEQSIANIAEVIVPIPADARERFFLQGARQIAELALHFLQWQAGVGTVQFRDFIKLCYDVQRFHAALYTIAERGPDERECLPDSAYNLALGLRAQFFDPATDATSCPPLNRTGQSVWAELSNHLSSLNTEQIKNVTSGTDWQPLDLRDGRTSVFVTLPPSAKGRYGAIMALVLNAHLGQLLSRPLSSGNAPILLLLDEMPQLGHMTAIEQVLDLGRGYGLLLYGFAQRRKQLEKSWGDTGDFLGTFQVRAYMNPAPEDGSADMISKAIGDTTRPAPKGGMETIPVAPPNELCGHEYRDDIIVLSRGARPARVAKHFAFADAEMGRKMALEGAPHRERYAPLRPPEEPATEA